MIFWIKNVQLHLPIDERKTVLDPYYKEVITMLNENVPAAFNLPFDDTEHLGYRTFERDFNICCSPRFILANICNDLYESNIEIDNFGYFSIQDATDLSLGMFKIGMHCTIIGLGIKDIGIFDD